MTEDTTVVPDLYIEAKKAVNAYQEEVQHLDAQEQELKAELAVLQEEMTQNMLDQEGSSVSDRIYLRIRGKEISSRADIIATVLAELQEERQELKLKYATIFKEALVEDRKQSPNFSAKVQAIIDGHIYAMLAEVADLSGQLKQQHNSISGGINAVYQDEKVNEVHRNLRYRFDWDIYKPSFSNFGKTVLNRNHIDYSLGGHIHPDFRNKQPEEGVSSE